MDAEHSPVVRGLVEAVLLEEGSTSEQTARRVDATAAVLDRKIRAMPRFMALGMAVLLWVFDWYGVLRAGRRFRSQAHAARRRRVGEWAGAYTCIISLRPARASRSASGCWTTILR